MQVSNMKTIKMTSILADPNPIIPVSEVPNPPEGSVVRE